MGFLDLLIVALFPVLKVLLVTGIGLFLASDGVNLLGPEARNHLNKIVFYVFGPALVASNLAETITPESFLTLWFMLVNILMTFIIGSLLGWILIKITNTPKHFQGIVIGSCSAGNLGNLPLVLVPAVCEQPKNPFKDSSDCSGNAKAYASLSVALGAIYIWSYVYAIIRSSANSYLENEFTNHVQSSDETSKTSLESGREALLPSKDHFDSGDSAGRIKISTWKKILESIKMAKDKIDLKEVLAPSAIAAIVAFVIGMISPIREVLIGDKAPLRLIGSSAILLGEPTVACQTLIMGANLKKGLRGSELSTSITVGIIAVRNIFMPLLGILVIKAAQNFSNVGLDPLYQFVLMLQYALPPAVAIGTMTQLFGVGQSESSVILLWTYAVAAFFLTFWSTIFMWLLE